MEAVDVIGETSVEAVTRGVEPTGGSVGASNGIGSGDVSDSSSDGIGEERTAAATVEEGETTVVDPGGVVIDDGIAGEVVECEDRVVERIDVTSGVFDTLSTVARGRRVSESVVITVDAVVGLVSVEVGVCVLGRTVVNEGEDVGVSIVAVGPIGVGNKVEVVCCRDGDESLVEAVYDITGGSTVVGVIGS